MLYFPNVRTEADFIRAYKYDLTRLMQDIRRYIGIHGFDQRKYDAMFGKRLSEFVELSTPEMAPKLSVDVLSALVMLWHKEACELAKDMGMPIEHHEDILAGYRKVEHLLEV